MENLKEFMLFFRMKPTKEQPTKEQQLAMHQQWGRYIGGIASNARLVSTSRLGFEGKTINNLSAVHDEIRVTEGETISGSMVFKAGDLDEATQMAMDCPILRLGGSIEIRSIIPMEA